MSNVLTNVQRGSIRDQAILDAISLCGVMDTEQITELFFRFTTGKRKCQARMKYLIDRKLVKKTRLSLDTSTIYYQGKLPKHLEHALALTWVYVWLMQKNGKKLLTWELEELKEFGNILQADALCSVKIPMTGEIRWYCIELDRGSIQRNAFDKVDKYTALYNLQGVAGSPMLKRLGNPLRFPKVIIVTDSVKRGQRIRELVANANTRLKFEVHLLSAIKEEGKTLCQL